MFEGHIDALREIVLGEPRGTERERVRQEQVSYHIGVRTLSCRSMFREISVLNVLLPYH